MQLGYDGAGTPIVFLPEVHDGVIRVPEMGTRIDRDRLAHLAPLKVAVTPPPDDRTWH